ncbi:MAG: tRNA uridine-5-carboxymethylaminomethyl(34) synthesis GTPase MnmE [Xanthobacteraceae bacterium]
MGCSRDTIFALSSGRPPAAIAVVRVSGPHARVALEALIGRVPEPRRAAFVRLRDPQNGDVMDEGLALWFPAPRSETGEDVAELQVHGGRAVIGAVLAALGRLEHFRPAEAGEFTRRAFENGRLDLTAVEGLADLVGAETQAQRRQAVRQLQGLLHDRAEMWRERLIKALALVEAGIDFSDEADVAGHVLQPALEIARGLGQEILEVLAGAERGERLREGLLVVIAGPPNVGKSTLLNRLARREAAIVSPFAGTTRDVIEIHLDLGGYPVTVLDTAGIRTSDDLVEQEGVRRARERARSADLVLWVLDASEEGPGRSAAAGPEAEFNKAPMWIIRNKSDLVDESRAGNSDLRAAGTFQVSALSGEGVDALAAELSAFAAEALGSAEPALVTRARQRHALEEAVAALRRADAEGSVENEDLVAEELRLAARALGRLTGRVDVEEVLDVIFRDFCIGK